MSLHFWKYVIFVQMSGRKSFFMSNINAILSDTRFAVLDYSGFFLKPLQVWIPYSRKRFVDVSKVCRPTVH